MSRRQAKRSEPAIPCDYCDAVATRFIQRGDRSARSFTCEVHRERASSGYHPAGYFTDPPLPGRSRFEDVRVDELERIWRAGARKELKRIARATASPADPKEKS